MPRSGDRPHPKEASAHRRLPIGFATLCAIAFLTNLGYGVVLPILPGLVERFGGGLSIGLVYSVFSAAKIGSQLVGGVLSDRYGDRRILLLSTVLYAITLAGLAFAQSPTAFVVLRILEGISVGLSYPAATAAVSRLAPPDRLGRDLGWLMGIGGLGVVVGPVIGILIGRGDVRLPLLALGALTLLASPLTWSIGASRVAREVPWSGEFRIVGRFLVSLPFVALVIPVAFNKIVFSVFQPLLPLHAQVLGLSDWMVAALFGGTGILFAAAQPLTGLLVDRRPARQVTSLALGGVGVLLGAMALFLSASGFVVLYLSYCFVGSMLFTADMKLVGDRFGERDAHGKIFGVAHSVTDLGMTVAPLLLLPLRETSPALLFGTLALLAAGAWLAFARGRQLEAALPVTGLAAGD